MAAINSHNAEIHRPPPRRVRSGFLCMAARCLRKGWHRLCSVRYVVYICELDELDGKAFLPRTDMVIRPVTSVATLPPEFRLQMRDRTGAAFEMQAERRFRNGASVWLIEHDTVIAGYLWTIGREPAKPYFWPMMDRDMLIIDVLVFEAYRGRGVAAYATEWVLHQLQRQGVVRAFIQTRDWNTAEQKSLAKTSFVKVGECSRSYRRKRNRVVWYAMTGQLPQKH